MSFSQAAGVTHFSESKILKNILQYLIKAVVFCATLFSISVPVVFAESLIRGPYLQSAAPTSIVIKWRTDVAADSQVIYGIPGGPVLIELLESTTTEHEIKLSGLQPDSTYVYTVGNTFAELVGGDDSYSFVTPPLPGTDKPTHIWVIGDSGTADENAASVRDAFKAHSLARRPNLWLMLGDNAYNTGTDANYQAAVFDMYPEILRQTVVWPTIGNHDTYASTPAYPQVFTLPIAGDAGGVASGTESYYSFDFGNIHFISLDSMVSNRAVTGAMLTWLANDLAANNQYWIIAFWHHPPYTKGSHDSDAQFRHIEMRENALPILEAYGVDLVLSGHSHSYERSFLLDGHYGDSTTLDVPTMVLNGGDGNETGNGAYMKAGVGGTPYEGTVYAVAGSSGKVHSAPFGHPAMFVGLLELGSMVVDVAGNRLEAVFIDDKGDVLDEFTLIKGLDVFAPALIVAEVLTGNKVSAKFSEPVDQLTAENPENYSINGLTIAGAVLSLDQRTVSLTVSLMAPKTDYVLAVINVEDMFGNVISSNNVQEVFNGMPTNVEIDVMPWSAANEIDPESNARILVSIHSTNTLVGDAIDFNTSEVDPSTLKFGPADAVIKLSPWAADLDADGDIDLNVGFDTQDTGITCSDTEVTLNGATYSGELITGTNLITTPNCPTGSCHP